MEKKKITRKFLEKIVDYALIISGNLNELEKYSIEDLKTRLNNTKSIEEEIIIKKAIERKEKNA